MKCRVVGEVSSLVSGIYDWSSDLSVSDEYVSSCPNQLVEKLSEFKASTEANLFFLSHAVIYQLLG